MSFSVLVTRPSHQNVQLNSALQQHGFKVISFPTIAIQAAEETPFLRRLKDNIHGYDIALFVSRNAVDYAFNYLDGENLPTALQLGVIGKGSWQALKKQGVESHIIPADSYNSEGLLASQALQQVAGKKVLVFRGQQGRTLLGDTLQQRGAKVDHVEVYRRELPEYEKDLFEQLTRPGFPDIAVFTSAEGLNNCFHLLNDQQAREMRDIDWLLISERMRETARILRHNAVIVIADKASDEGILSALQGWRKAKV